MSVVSMGLARATALNARAQLGATGGKRLRAWFASGVVSETAIGSAPRKGAGGGASVPAMLVVHGSGCTLRGFAVLNDRRSRVNWRDAPLAGGFALFKLGAMVPVATGQMNPVAAAHMGRVMRRRGCGTLLWLERRQRAMAAIHLGAGAGDTLAGETEAAQRQSRQAKH